MPEPYTHSFAFHKEIGTTDNNATLRSLLDVPKTILVMLDLERAFKLADPTVITAILAEKGVKGKLLGWIQDYLTNRSASVSFQGHTSRSLTFEKSIPQGGILSPFLFNLLVEQLVKLHFQADTKLFAYADDLRLVSTGQHRYAHTEQALDIITKECNRIGLKINPTKSSAIYTSGELPGPL
ncbi:uncharacterized protein LOC125029908 [Penaeus chinensis]|uniref:uncharacterized protein LOC125029908 n=1 Tax=Penaeus chinensis TaxID=139456 RepID=UPI001FB78213|nr:uncharacterized protein LOC125029908 [Penaeus chinensis]